MPAAATVKTIPIAPFHRPYMGIKPVAILPVSDITHSVATINVISLPIPAMCTVQAD